MGLEAVPKILLKQDLFIKSTNPLKSPRLGGGGGGGGGHISGRLHTVQFAHAEKM